MAKLITFSVIILAVASAPARDLTNVEIFSRCYAQIAQLFPAPTNPRLVAVRNGTKDPIVACLEILDLARFNNNGQIPNVTDNDAVAVLRTMHNLHSSWLDTSDFPNIADFGNNRDLRDVYDPTQPALYFTRALLDPATPYSSVVTSSQHLRPARTTDDPTVSISGRNKSESQFLTFKWAPIGSLAGYLVTNDMVWNFQGTSGTGQPLSGTATAGKNAGGGIMGSPAYLLLTIAETANTFRANGATIMPRKWARAVFHDLLCRPLPAVRMSDAADYVRPNSTTEFRKSQTCTTCHVSHDRLSGVIRNFQYQVVARFQDVPPAGGIFPRWLTANQPAESEWPSEPDNNYAARPPTGIFYFRNYLGELKNIQSIGSLAQLGTVIADQPDFYICAAKRYYEYFTGIATDIGDLGDATHRTLSNVEKKHRDEVINLGLALKSHQSLRKLIESIIRLPQYRKSDYQN